MHVPNVSVQLLISSDTAEAPTSSSQSPNLSSHLKACVSYLECSVVTNNRTDGQSFKNKNYAVKNGGLPMKRMSIFLVRL